MDCSLSNRQVPGTDPEQVSQVSERWTRCVLSEVTGRVVAREVIVCVESGLILPTLYQHKPFLRLCYVMHI